jgi:acyl dehydratase
MTTTIQGIDGLRERVGDHLGYSEWHQVTQEQVNTFAEATGDFQWIHVDVERAKQGPFGGPIAHGYLTLSLAPLLIPQIVKVEGITMAVNYGLNKVRFITPVKVDSRIRAGVAITGVDDARDGALQVTGIVTVEIEGSPKPAAVAETVTRLYR